MKYALTRNGTTNPVQNARRHVCHIANVQGALSRLANPVKDSKFLSNYLIILAASRSLHLMRLPGYSLKMHK
jgi:hypothetical protein